MLSPSDFNNAVPQFTNGDYASNPINPQYIAEPGAEDYNRGTEPLQTLPAQWWNWFLNRFTNRFNKVNVYVKNIFNELAQVLSIFNITPDGTEQTPTTSQLKTIFECCYPQYVKTAANLVGTATTVNGHPLSSNVTVTRSDLGLGTSATVNTGTAAGCIPTVGTALGTTDGQFLATDANGKLKPSGYSASSFRASSWTPAIVCCAKCNGSGVAFGSAATCNASAFRPSTWTPSLVNCSCCNYIDVYTASADRGVVLTCAVTAAGQYQTLGPSVTCKFTFNPATGEVKAKTFTGALAGCACCAGRNGSGTAFGTAATCAATCFLSATGCAADSAKLGGTAASSYLKTNGCAADSAKLGGTAASSYVKIETGNQGTAYWRRIDKYIYVCWSATTIKCDVWKAFCAASPAKNTKCYTGVVSDSGWSSVMGVIENYRPAICGCFTASCVFFRDVESTCQCYSSTCTSQSGYVGAIALIYPH